ncbi:hypothetical protein [Micromonospora sp. DT47]|uniref:hypothetical protein n=1 Tax=Micromonospora sp. DT47 TaxID=3393431 RepID=UPI003CE76D27
MSAHFCAPPVPGAACAAPSYRRMTGVALVKRRHVDLMRVCSDACRRPAAH